MFKVQENLELGDLEFLATGSVPFLDYPAAIARFTVVKMREIEAITSEIEAKRKPVEIATFEC